MTNKWIADRGYGTGMALAFEGDEDFIRKSVNFASNFLLSEKAQVRYQTPSFAIVNTSMENLQRALALEGYCLKMRELLADVEVPFLGLDEDDLPDDFADRVLKFEAALYWAVDAKQVAEAMKLDPLRGVLPQATPEMEREAIKAGNAYAEIELAKIHFEDFMRHISTAPVQAHALQLENAFSE